MKEKRSVKGRIRFQVPLYKIVRASLHYKSICQCRTISKKFQPLSESDFQKYMRSFSICFFLIYNLLMVLYVMVCLVFFLLNVRKRFIEEFLSKMWFEVENIRFILQLDCKDYVRT